MLRRPSWHRSRSCSRINATPLLSHKYAQWVFDRAAAVTALAAAGDNVERATASLLDVDAAATSLRCAPCLPPPPYAEADARVDKHVRGHENAAGVAQLVAMGFPR